jgi:molybdenum-dependent DNA-binding transcriptional regulator ModE
MFGLFKSNPLKKLEEQYARKLTEAVEAQRNGKTELYAKLKVESEEILKKIEELKSNQQK